LFGCERGAAEMSRRFFSKLRPLASARAQSFSILLCLSRSSAAPPLTDHFSLFTSLWRELFLLLPFFSSRERIRVRAIQLHVFPNRQKTGGAGLR